MITQFFSVIADLQIIISDLAQNSELLLRQGLREPGPLTIALVFGGGLLTSLGPCSLSLLPVTVAYLAGFNNQQNPLQKSFVFCSGIVSSLVILGSISGLAGIIYGQVPELLPVLTAVIAILMGLTLIGLLKLPLPEGPNPKSLEKLVPNAIAPYAAGLAFGLAASPCTTPVLAVLLGWIAQSGNPLTGILLLGAFGIGQVLPLLIAGTAAGTIPKLMALKPFAQWIPKTSGVVLLTTGVMTLLAKWL